jgi:hypothetical protein
MKCTVGKTAIAANGGERRKKDKDKYTYNGCMALHYLLIGICIYILLVMYLWINFIHLTLGGWDGTAWWTLQDA